MFNLLGVSESLSPEETYSFWYQRIDSRYIECVLKTIEKIRAGNKSEVEYPWNHPQLGWIYVRLGGDLDKSCSKNIFRMKGYHHDITELLGINQQYYTDHEVVDFYKLKRYSDYFMDNYDELFEVDLEDYSIKKLYLKYENDTVTVQTGASIGVSLFPQNGTTFQELYETADQAMYYAKHRQKNTYFIYE